MQLPEFLQEWNEACAYARECILPPVVFENADPFSFFGSIFVMCFAIWLWNEKKIKRASR